MKCVNCDKDAMYKVEDPGANPLHYCHKCLPLRLHARARKGDYALPIVDDEAPKVKKTTKN